MTDDQEAVAPSEATPEVVQPDAGQDVSPEGQQEPPASEPEEKSEAQKRRERRRAQEQRQLEEYAAAEAKAREWQARLDRIKTAAAGVEPKEADFSDIGEYWAAKGAWNYARQAGQIQVAEVSAEAEQAKALVETQRAAQAMARQAEFQQEAADARTRYPDFDAALAVASNAQFVSPALSEMVLASDQPADLAYHLGKNPQEAIRLSALPPIIAAREIGKLEARLVATPPKIASTAPPPINPVRASGVAVKDIEKMSLDEFRAFKAGGGFKR